jgi:carbon-monoxide dehydrogenase medium subunit
MDEPVFASPRTLDEALEAVRDGDALIVGGGTSLAVLLKQRLVEPEKLVWLGRVDELTGISRDADGALLVGAITTVAEIAASAEVRTEHPIVAHAARVIANPRIRAVATVAGALVHGDPRQDLPPALLVTGASVRIVGPRGERTMQLSDGFFRGFLETAVEPDELVTHVRLPASTRTQEAYRRFTPQSMDDYPTVSVAVGMWRSDAGVVSHLSLALGGVASTPLLVEGVDGFFAGGTPSPSEIAAVAEHARSSTSPTADERGSAEYKAAMAELWTRRVLTELVENGDDRADSRD